MSFAEFVCEKIKTAGNVKAKPMVGTHNIVLDNISLGIVCTNMGDSGRWYLKKTLAGDAFLAANNICLETGINGKSYIVTDFSDEEMLCELARLTRNEIVKSKSKGFV